MKVLVTGASGYIGSHLVPRLVERGDEVRALTRSADHGVYRCLVTGTVADLDAHLTGVTHVVHLAGRLVDDPQADIGDYYPANVELTETLMQGARRAGVRSIAHASSRLVYPRTLTAPARERHDEHPDTAYGMSKLWAENVVRLYADDSSLSALSLRIGQVTGGGHPGLGVIRSFARQARVGGPVRIQGSGKAVREFVHVDDVVSAILASLDYEGRWRPVNIGGTRAISVEEIAHCVAALADQPVQVTHSPTERDDLSVYALDPTVARATLPWEPQRTPEQIIAEALNN